MAEDLAQRHLAVVLAAEVVGYSRLMERDEAGTLDAFKPRQAEILQPVVSKHHSRIVKLMGDGVPVEFASTVNLRGAIKAANAEWSEDWKITLPVGVNLSVR